MVKAIKAQHKRRNYFIDKAFQGSFILKFCALVTIGGVLTIGILYLLAMHSNTVAFVNSRVVVKTTADFILPILIQTVLVVSVFVSLATVVVTMVISHKIAGPLYRFRKVIQKLSEGDFSSDFSIRHNDQLQDLSKELNAMITRVGGELARLKNNLFSFEEKLEGFSGQEISDAKKKDLTELKEFAKDIGKTAQFFKT